jgi:hypothetical protein
MKTYLRRFWARIWRSVRRKPQQMELNLWIRCSRPSSSRAKSVRCGGNAKRATIQSISRGLLSWKPLAGVRDAEVPSLNLFYQAELKPGRNVICKKQPLPLRYRRVCDAPTLYRTVRRFVWLLRQRLFSCHPTGARRTCQS